METSKEQYRLAFSYLLEKTGIKVDRLAEEVECTARHLNGILSEHQRKGYFYGV